MIPVNQYVQQAVVIPNEKYTNDKNTIRLNLFNVDGTPFVFEGSGESGPVAWADITGKPAVMASGSDAAAARSAIDAAQTTHAHTGTQVTLTGYSSGSSGSVSPSDTVNAAIAKLEARIAALESA